MINFKTEPIVKAVTEHPEAKYRIAVLAGMTTTTMDKILASDIELTLISIDKLADYLGFDVEVSFKKKAAEPIAA